MTTKELARAIRWALAVLFLALAFGDRAPFHAAKVDASVVGGAGFGVRRSFATLPLSFERNVGQADKSVEFLSRGPGYGILLHSAGALLTLNISQGKAETTKTRVVQMIVAGGNLNAAGEGLQQLPGTSNYFVGADSSRWKRNIRTYARVRYADAYPGIDLVYYGTQRELEYDFIVSPAADPSKIRLRFEGQTDGRIDQEGNLVLTLGGVTIRERKPVIYQDIDGTRRPVAGGYVSLGKGEFGFRVGAYDRQRPLVIDPVIVYSSYLGGSGMYGPGQDFGGSARVDSDGSVYLSGTTGSVDFPIVNALQPTTPGEPDAYLAKVTADGSALAFSTFLGGSNVDYGSGLFLDGGGHVYLSGSTRSDDFPITIGPSPSEYGPFVVKLNHDGNALIYSTLIDGGEAVAVGSDGSVYSVGNTVSPSFPTVHPFQGTLSGGQDATITKLAPDGSTRLYATYFGGTGDDWVNAIDVDETGQIYIAGVTQSGDLPTKNAIQPSYAGGSHDCWVAKLKADGSGLIYSTYWGGTGEELCFVSAGRHGDAYVTGDTYSADFPVVKALQPALKGLSEGIVVKLDANGSVVYSTYLGGSGDDGTGTVNIGPNDVAYIGGNTNSDDFPVYRAVQSHLGGSPAHNPDAIAVKLSPNGELLFSTYLGGSYYDVGGAVVPDAAGNMYVSGTTWSDDFPVRHAFQPAFGGGADAFVAKIADPWCPTDVTSRVDVLKFPPKQFIFGFLRFQLVAIHNKTSSSIGGPLALVLSDLQQAAFIGSSWKTQCFSPEGDPFTLVSAGFDGLLRPNESRLTTLWFLNTNPDQLAYVPHVLSGIPVQ